MSVVSSLTNSSIQADQVFSGLLENNPSKVAVAVVAALLVLIFVFLNLGTVWYDYNGFDQYRTLIYRIPSLISVTCLFFIPIMVFVEFIILFFWPFSQNFCLLNIIYKNSVKTLVIILADFLILARYIFICHLKNPAALDDKLWTALIFIWFHIIKLFCLSLMLLQCKLECLSPGSRYLTPGP